LNNSTTESQLATKANSEKSANCARNIDVDKTEAASVASTPTTGTKPGVSEKEGFA